MSKNIQPIINGDGKQTRDFTFISDVVEAFILATKTNSNNCSGEPINIGGGKNISVNEVTQSIIEIAGTKITPKHGPKVVEPKNTLADISKAHKLLGWEPKTPFTQGLRQTYDYFSQNR